MSMRTPSYRLHTPTGTSASGIASKNNTRVDGLEVRLMAAAGDNLFRQEDWTKRATGGFARRHFAELSQYTHGAPGKTEADLWQSNGPVYHPEVLKDWSNLYSKTMALAVLMRRLCLAERERRAKRIKSLYEATRLLVSSASDGAALLGAIASDQVRG
jgi:hypothetical protein